MIRILFVIVLAITISSCKEDKTVSIKGKDLSKEIVPAKDLPIPSSCKYMSVQWIADRFNLDPELINVTDGNAGEGMSGCFFRWATKDRPNAGLFVQVFTNTLESEGVKNWASLRMKGLRAGNAGSTEIESATFKPFPGVGDEGAYNDELGHYYWRIGENYFFMLAFNLDLSPEERFKHAQEISKEVMKNFSSLIK